MSVWEAIKTIANRFDNWQNDVTGFGTVRDKSQAAGFFGDLEIQDPELTALFHNSDMGCKIVSIVPREMLRQGFKVSSDDKALADALTEDCKRLGVRAKFREAITWARLYGGACIFVGANDGGKAEQPLNPAAVKSVSFLDIYDRRYAVVYRRYEDKTNPKYGEPEVYQLNKVGTGNVAYVHETRLIKFHGAMTDVETKIRLNGWDHSVLQRCYGPLRQFDAAYNAGELMLTDASQGVFKIKGLLSAIASGNKADILTRAQLVDMGRSISRSIMLDSEGEDFTKIATQFAGVADMLDRAANRLSAASEIPVTILMGQAPAGLNATGASDVRVFYDTIASEQETELKPRLVRLLNLLTIARKSPATATVTFPSLWQETATEKSARRKADAEKDVLYITNEVVTPEEVAKARFTGDDADFEIDMANREGAFLVPPAPMPPAPVAPPAK